MKILIRFLLLPVLLLAASCTERMDPFEGADGLRANINGYKCVMDGNHGNQYVTRSAEGTSVSIRVNMVQLIDNQTFTMQLFVSDAAPLAPGTTYRFSTGSGCTAQLGSPPGAPGEEINMTGWIRFLQLGADSNIVEAEFELEGVSPRSQTDYEVRHGFLRLYR